MRDYGKVFSTFWTSDSTRDLSDDAKVLALYLLTGPHSNIIGCYRLPDGYISEDLGWTLQRVSKGFGELFQKGFATRDEDTKWVFVNNHLKWNPLENPNQITGGVKLYDQIPDASTVKPLIAKALRKYTKPDLRGFETLPKPFADPSETLSEPETETETETEGKSGDLQGGHPAPPPCPFSKIVELYHEILPEHPRVEMVSTKRERVMKARWGEVGERLRMKNKDDSHESRLTYLRHFFLVASKSDILTGKKAFSDGGVYMVTFDKLMSPDGFLGVIERKYDNREAA